MKKICSVVGARPQFIKLAVVSRLLRKRYHEIIIHTGQHYDYNMSDIFFEEMEIPKPDYNLGISGGTHGEMTGTMIIELEKVFLKENPDMVLLFGDTNSTMAAAIAAVKLHLPICHVEAGNRFGTLDSPEEVNRIITDHLATINFPCTQSAYDFLMKENLGNKSFITGDPMYDAFKFYSSKLVEKGIEPIVSLNGETLSLPEKFYFLTCHRQENTDTDKKLFNILLAMNSLDYKTVYPVHPRNCDRAKRICEENKLENIILIKPVGYLTSLYLENNAVKIVTDSGGVQREAFFAKKQCVTVLDFVVWPETMVNNCNQLARPDKNDIIQKLSKDCIFSDDYAPFGDGHSAEKIIDNINSYFSKKEV